MSNQQIDDMIQHARIEGSIGHDTYHILGSILKKIAEIEARLDNTERSAKRTADVASCLANGIQAD